MHDLSELLRERGLRATQGRLALLAVLSRAKRPLSVDDIKVALGKKLNGVTIYRALEALSKAGVVTVVDLRHSSVHYEMVAGRPHHHHLVCDGCGSVEDVDVAEPKDFEEKILRQSKQFGKITSHSLEFFGMCRSCVKVSH